MSATDAADQAPRSQTSDLVAFVVCLAVFAFGSWVASSWGYPRLVAANSAWIGATGWLLTAWGIALALVGFGVTWWQLYRTRTAAQRVAAALKGIRSDYAAFDVVTELRTAKAAGEDALACLEGDRWAEAVQAYDRVRASLVKMSSINGGLSEEQSNTAKDFAGDMLTACDVVSENRVASPADIPKVQMISNLRVMNNFMITLEQELKDGIGG